MQRKSAAVESATRSTAPWWKDLRRLKSTARQKINRHPTQMLQFNHHPTYPHQELQVQIHTAENAPLMSCWNDRIHELIVNECQTKIVIVNVNSAI